MFKNIRRIIMKHLRNTFRSILPTHACDNAEDGPLVQCYGEDRAYAPKCTKCDALLSPTVVTCEDVCVEIGEKLLHISPAALGLFSLSMGPGVRDGTGPTWLSPGENIMEHKHEEIYFRVRYFPKNCELLMNFDAASLKYLYRQMLRDYLSDKLTLTESVSRGLTVLCILVEKWRNSEEQSNNHGNGEVVDENMNSFLKKIVISDFLPPSLHKSLILQNTCCDKPIKKKLHEYWVQYRRGQMTSLRFMKAFLDHILKKMPCYYRETYTAFTLQGGAGNKLTEVCVEIQMDLCDASMAVKALDSTSTADAEWLIKNLSSLEVKRQEIGGSLWWEVMIVRQVGVPQMLYFERELEMKSCLTCLEGYYRLTVDYYQSLLTDIQPAKLHSMQTIRAFGPVSSQCIGDKLSAKPNGYILRPSMSEYHQYEVVYKRDTDGELTTRQLGKVLQSESGYKIDGADDWVRDFKLCIHNAVRQLGVVGTQERLKPQMEVCDQLLQIVTATDVPIITDNEDQEQEISHLPRVYSAGAVTLNAVIGQGYFTEVLDAVVSGERVVVKRVRADVPQQYLYKCSEALQEGMNKYVTEFLTKTTHFIGLVGVSLGSPVQFIEPRAEFRSLEWLLQHRPPDPPLYLDHLMNAALQVVSALLCLEENHCYHGNLHCGNVLVLNYGHREMGVKLADVGFVSLYNQLPLHSNINTDRIPWLAPELFESFSRTSIQSDIYAYSTTLWQMFSNGASPRDENQALHEWSTTEMLAFYKSGDKLSCPAFLQKKDDDPYGIQTIKVRMFDLMASCWQVDPEERPCAKSIVRSLNTVLVSYGGTYHEYNVIHELHIPMSVSAISVDNYPLDAPTSGDTSLYTTSSRRLEATRGHNDMFSMFTSCDFQPLVVSLPVTAASQTPPTVSTSMAVTTTTTMAANIAGTSPAPPATNIRTSRAATGNKDPVVNISPVMGLGAGPVLPMAIPPRVRPVVLKLQHLIPENRLTINDSVVLGRGHYGLVYRGQLLPSSSAGFTRTQDVAVKVMKPEMLDKYGELFKREIRVNEQLNHKNIVKFYGVCRNGAYIVMEFVARGALISYLSTCARDKATISPAQMLRFFIDIATGMEYLSANHVIHCDLAARNILLTSDLTAKVSDFGLSKVLSLDTDYYRRSDASRNLPIFWCAPEWLGHQRRFMTTSDVWSYGIVLWECYSYGSKPNICATDSGFVKEGFTRLNKGERLKQPPECPCEVYHLMLACWNLDPDKRPGFTECLQRLTDIQLKSVAHGDVQQVDSNVTPSSQNSPTSTNKSLAELTNGSKAELTNETTPKSANGSRAELTNGNITQSTNGSSARLSNRSTAPSGSWSRGRLGNRNTAPSMGSVSAGTRGGHHTGISSGDYSKVPAHSNVLLDKSDILISTDLLGKGAYGCVYRGTYGGDQVAVKCFTAQDKDYFRFKREMELLYHCDHRHVVKLIGMFGLKGDDVDTYVMEFMEKGDMKSYLAECQRSGSPADLQRKLTFLVDIAEGMAYLSAQNILHCDLTAVNVLLTAELTAKISDLGWAKELEGEEWDGTYQRKHAKFKPLWHAPEVFAANYNRATDVWSYGVVCLEVFLDGGEPTLAHTGHADLLRQLEAGTRFPRPPECPEDVYDGVMLKCWQYSSAARPTFADLLIILGQLLQNIQDNGRELQAGGNRDNLDAVPNVQDTEMLK